MSDTKIDLVLGDQLGRVIAHMTADSDWRKSQDLIRAILLADPSVINAAQRYGIVLADNSVTRGGFKPRRNPVQDKR